MATRILLADDDPTVRSALVRAAAAVGAEPVCATDEQDALGRLAAEEFDLCVTSMHAVLEAGRKQPVLMLTGDSTVKQVVAVVRAGAVDFVAKPFPEDLLADRMRHALTVTDGNQRRTAGMLLREHPGIRLMLERIEQISDSDANVLVRGEPAAGTDVVARLVHASSTRRGDPFVHVEATALSATLLDSALARAKRGTLFVQEVGELGRALQERLLRSLHEPEVRVIAATSRGLAPRLRDGSFLDELYFRLDVIPLEVPPLSASAEAVEDVDLPPYGVDLRLLLTQLEHRLIGQALQRTGGNKNRAAELLGLNRTTLVEKLRRRNVA